MSRINQLDPIVINKIAAGEVIERPANVVKECLENSLDALATRIEVDIEKGGTELIRIVDDGEGVHPDDFLLTVSSHATSKIQSAEDLFQVQTMGFRGEALASIASVCRFRIRSRQQDQISGFELEVNGGEMGTPQPCGCPVGTQIEVKQLFGNTPVRRKYLKTVGTEFGHISEQFTRVALANPRLHMVLRHNNKTVYELPATNQLIDRIRLFHGSQLAEQLIYVEAEHEGAKLWGYVAHPGQSKSTRKGQYLFLNGRWIQDRSLQHALGEAYRGLLMVGRQPIAYLFLEISPDDVDVNVHPTKTEVRFRDGQLLYRLLLNTLRTKFLGMDLDSAMTVSEKGEQPLSPVEVEQQQLKQKELIDWAAEQLQQFTPTESTGTHHTHANPHFASSGKELFTPSSQFGSFKQGGNDFKPFPNPYTQQITGETAFPDRSLAGAPTDNQISTTSTERTENSAAYSAQSRALQVLDCYLVLETEAGLMIIDQHALHERIMYERLRKRILDGSVESQRLLVPETIEMSAKEISLLLDSKELLEQLGFGIEEFGKGTILLNAYPALLHRADHIEMIRDIADQLDRPGAKPDRRDLLESLLQMMSCKAAIKAGQRLAPEEMESLLAQRNLCDDAHHCPHGRPTAMILSRDQLDKQFGRLG